VKNKKLAASIFMLSEGRAKFAYQAHLTEKVRASFRENMVANVTLVSMRPAPFPTSKLNTCSKSLHKIWRIYFFNILGVARYKG